MGIRSGMASLECIHVAPSFLSIDASLQILGAVLLHALYNVFLHPLANFPGPLLGRASLVCSLREIDQLDGLISLVHS